MQTTKVRVCKVVDCGQECRKHPDGHYNHAYCPDHHRARALVDTTVRKAIMDGEGLSQKAYYAIPQEERTMLRRYYKDNPETKRRKNAERRTVAGQRVYGSSPLHPSRSIKDLPAFESLPAYVSSDDGAGRSKSGKGHRSRKNAVKFRKYVLARDRCCVITGTPVTAGIVSKGSTRTLIQAAHIKPYKICGPGEYDDLANGLAMRVDAHAAFDNALFTIDQAGMVIPSPRWFVQTPFRTFVPMSPEQLEYLSGHEEWARQQWARWHLESQ